MSRVAWWSLLLLLGGCGSSVPPPGEIAQLDGEPISYLSFDQYLQRNAVEGAGAMGSDVLSSLLDQFLDEQLLSRLATDRLGSRARMDARSASRALLESYGEEPDDASVALYYRQDLDRFDRPERVHLRQLLFTDRDTANQIQELWAKGTPFGQIQEMLADDGTAHVGEEGEFTRSGLPSVFADTLFEMSAGDVSSVLAADYGYHVFQVVRHLDAGLVPFEEVLEALREELATRQREQILSRLAAEARERYNVRVFERNLPFNYSGRYESNNTHENS